LLPPKKQTQSVASKRGVDLISDALPFGGLWYAEPNAVSNAIGYAKFFSRSHDAVIRVYDEAGNVIEAHEHAEISKSGEFLPRNTAHFPLRRCSMASLSAGDCEGRGRIIRNNSTHISLDR
jgi:hypothetical protein